MLKKLSKSGVPHGKLAIIKMESTIDWLAKPHATLFMDQKKTLILFLLPSSQRQKIIIKMKLKNLLQGLDLKIKWILLMK